MTSYNNLLLVRDYFTLFAFFYLPSTGFRPTITGTFHKHASVAFYNWSLEILGDTVFPLAPRLAMQLIIFRHPAILTSKNDIIKQAPPSLLHCKLSV